MSQFFSEEAITNAMIDGLKEGMRKELHTRILKELEDDIEDIVSLVVSKMNASANSMVNPFDFDKKIRLDVLFMHTHETKVVHENKMTIVQEK
jgi:hypothetical protein